VTARVAGAFIAACRGELEALKPGNVHVHAPGHGMTVEQFEASAAAAAGPLCAPGARVGARIRRAVEATVKAVGTNTNLGIILLCAPLAAAAEPACFAVANGKGPDVGKSDLCDRDLRESLFHVLDSLDVADAVDAFEAIVQASPAGLGRAAQHDVFAPPQVSLRQAMAAAADRDRVARQYVTGFADVFDLGLPLHAGATARWGEPGIATLAVYLGFLSRFPDSHILRKHGAGAADEVVRSAQKFDSLLREAEDPAGLSGALLAWDADLKARRINPGTTADLTVATLFCISLQSVLPSARISG
jgi:triphosphoribosyl-dephospho-CoA synthase